MGGHRIHRVSGVVLVVLSLTALLAVLSGYRLSLRPFSIHPQPPQPDEGTQAHVFQLSLAALAPTILLFLVTADWKRPLRDLRPLALSAAAVTLALVALYHLEHHP
jgi:hypothetical protein